MKKVVSRALLRLLSSSSSSSIHFLLGAWKSTVSGQGLEVKEVRPFSPGDNPWAAVWSRFAQTGTLYAKNFQEERGRIVYLALDLSGSMFQGSQKKALFARELFGYLAWAATQSSDKVGAIMNAGNEIRVIRPKSGHSQAELLVQEAEQDIVLPSSASLASFFSQESGHELKRSYLLYISDFLEPSRDWKKLFVQLAHQHEVQLFHVQDEAEEQNLASAVGVTVFDPEDDEGALSLLRHDMYTTRKKIVEDEYKRVRSASQAARIPIHALSVQQECLTQLIQALQRKK